MLALKWAHQTLWWRYQSWSCLSLFQQWLSWSQIRCCCCDCIFSVFAFTLSSDRLLLSPQLHLFLSFISVLLSLSFLPLSLCCPRSGLLRCLFLLFLSWSLSLCQLHSGGRRNGTATTRTACFRLLVPYFIFNTGRSSKSSAVSEACRLATLGSNILFNFSTVQKRLWSYGSVFQSGLL